MSSIKTSLHHHRPLLLRGVKLKIGCYLSSWLFVVISEQIEWNFLTIMQNVKPFCSGGVRKVMPRRLWKCIILSITMRISPILLWIQTCFISAKLIVTSKLYHNENALHEFHFKYVFLLKQTLKRKLQKELKGIKSSIVTRKLNQWLASTVSILNWFPPL